MTEERPNFQDMVLDYEKIKNMEPEERAEYEKQLLASADEIASAVDGQLTFPALSYFAWGFDCRNRDPRMAWALIKQGLLKSRIDPDQIAKPPKIFTRSKAETKPAAPSKSRKGGSRGKGPNERCRALFEGCKFTLKAGAKNYRKEGTDGWSAIEFIRENPGATADQIAEAGNFMQHVKWDHEKKQLFEVEKPT